MTTAVSSLLSFALGALLSALAAGFGGIQLAMLAAVAIGIVSVGGALMYVQDAAAQMAARKDGQG